MTRQTHVLRSTPLILTRATLVNAGLALASASTLLYAQEAARKVVASESSTLHLRLSLELDAARPATVQSAQATDVPLRLPLRTAGELQPAPANTGLVYVDRLIDDGAKPDDDLVAEPMEAEASGRRFASIDYGLFARSQSANGSSLEQGTGIRYWRETQDFGELHLEADLRNYSPAPIDSLPPANLRQRFTLYQYRFPVNERWQMDNALGVFRGNANPLISSSFRIQLPSSILQGGSNISYDQNSEWRFIGGNLGQLTGFAIQEFDATGGDLSGIGYSRKIDDNWIAAAQLYNLVGHATVADHQSLAWATQYQTSDRTRRLQLHGLNDSQGNNGLWFDGEERVNFWQHRYGAFRMAPNLLYTDALVPSDLQGGYWRTDFRSQRYNFSGGADFTDNNITNDPSRAGNRIASGFVSAFMRVDRTTNVSGNLSLTETNPKFSTVGVASSRTLLTNTSLAERFAFGTSNFQFSHSHTDSSVDPSREDTLRWDHDWTGSSALQFSTTLAESWANKSGLRSTRNTAGVLFRHFASSIFRWDGSLTVNRSRDDAGQADKNTSASLNGNWVFSRDWTARLQLVWNRIDSTNPVFPVFTNEKSLLFALRYEIASGSPLPLFGQATGGLGTGRIIGRVFFDDNGDGVRQAVERGVAGLIVRLDGRYPSATDNEGRFEFGPVATGDHTITVTLDRIPLPWGLLDDSPRRVNVPLRGEGLIEIPLNKLNQ